ncbi:RNA-binding protein 1-like [Periplaneta americana]
MFYNFHRFASQKMSRYREWDLSCKVYVGDLGSSASKHEIESAFSTYGPLRNVWVARNPSGFAFVEFEDPRDAEDAVRGLDGTRMCGTRVRVEMSSGRSRRGGGGGGGHRGSAPTRYSRVLSSPTALLPLAPDTTPIFMFLLLPT